MIYIIEDDNLMAKCISLSIKPRECKIFNNVIDAIENLDKDFPDLIFLDVLLPGPDGFTFLNELASYPDTAKIPIILVSGLDFSKKDLKIYNIKGILKKEEMTPKEIRDYAERYTN